MNRIHSHLNEIDMIGKLADLKDAQYHQSLVIEALIELFVEKNIITRKELALKAAELESLANFQD